MMSNKTATCERTGNTLLLSDGFFVADPTTKEWAFISADAPERNAEYNIAVASMMKSPEALVDWLAHLHEKTWFDAQKFFSFFTRFRHQNNLYDCL